MIKTLRITNHLGELLSIDLGSPEQSGFSIRDISGLGPSKSTVNLSESLYGDGGFFNSARLSSRNIVFTLGFVETPIETIEMIRNKTYRFFPMKRPVTIEIETDLRTGVTQGYVESNEPNIFSKDEQTQISVICPGSYFLSKELVETTFTGSTGGFEFPWENDSITVKLLKFADIFINTIANVFYEGDTETGVIIQIEFLGAVNDLTISNVDTGENMAISSSKLIALTGSNFVAGDFVEISTIHGNKYITLVRGTTVWNILNTIGTVADWFTIDRGDNLFTYTAQSGLANVKFKIFHNIVYEGL